MMEVKSSMGVIVAAPTAGSCGALPGAVLGAASVALQNSLGMVCGPIANRVEAPCLGKNVMAASNALSCTNMALADYDPLIPLDEAIEAMYEAGNSIPNTLRCNNLGGLSITKTAKALEAKLEQQQFFKSC